MSRFVTAQEVAEFLSVKPSWVYAEARAGRIPHVRIGRYRRFSIESVEAWAKGLEGASHPLGQPPGVQPGG